MRKVISYFCIFR